MNEFSGIMDIDGERIVPTVDCNHKIIYRFGENFSERYKTIFRVLRTWVEEVDQG